VKLKELIDPGNIPVASKNSTFLHSIGFPKTRRNEGTERRNSNYQIYRARQPTVGR